MSFGKFEVQESQDWVVAQTCPLDQLYTSMIEVDRHTSTWWQNFGDFSGIALGLVTSRPEYNKTLFEGQDYVFDKNECYYQIPHKILYKMGWFYKIGLRLLEHF